ncbi:unnamed protein product [Dicrocoelium dendriticum]|nr:unnamed protein product [Dicrocoelium dendriticum]
MLSAEEKRISTGHIYLKPDTVYLKNPTVHHNLAKHTSVINASHIGDRHIVETKNILTEQLKGIRNQLVRSLIRVRELEDQLRSIPALKKRVVDLTSQVAKQKSFSDYLLRLLSMSPQNDKHGHETVTSFLSSSMDSRFISVEGNNPVNANTVARSSETSFIDLSLGISCTGITTNCYGQVIGHNCALRVATELKNFVERNDKLHHRWFDDNRLGEFIQCCRDADWQHILQMLQIIGPTPSPLPAPPSAVELESSLVTKCLNASVSSMEPCIPHIGQVIGETYTGSCPKDLAACVHQDLESCELSWDSQEDSFVIDRHLSLPLLGVGSHACLLYHDSHVPDDISYRMFMASGICESSKETVSIICVSVLHASHSILLEGGKSRKPCVTLGNKCVSFRPGKSVMIHSIPTLKGGIPELKLGSECHAEIISVRRGGSLVKQPSILCDFEMSRSVTNLSDTNAKSLVYSVIETTDELVVSETKEVSIPHSSTLVQNAVRSGITSTLGAIQHAADMKSTLAAPNNTSVQCVLKSNAHPTDLRPKTQIPAPGSLTIRLTKAPVSPAAAATGEPRIGQVQTVISNESMGGTVLSSCKVAKRTDTVYDRKTPESRVETKESSKSADRTETDRFLTGKLTFPTNVSKEQIQTEQKENAKKDRYRASACGHNIKFIASCGMLRPRSTPQVKVAQSTDLSTVGVAAKTDGDGVILSHTKMSSWKFVKLSKNKRRTPETSECDARMTEPGKLAAKEETVDREESGNPKHENDAKQQQIEESPPSKAVTGLVSVAFLAACQTLAVWLEDSTTVISKAMNEATDTVRRIWFEVTSGPAAEASRLVAHIEALQCLPACPVDRIVNMVDHTGNTALHYAVCHGRWLVVDALIANCPGINVDTFNRAGYTPSMLAAVVLDQVS